RQPARTQHLDGDSAVELGVARPEDGAEAADAQLLQQLELAQAPPRAGPAGGLPRVAGRPRRRHDRLPQHVPRRAARARGPARRRLTQGAERLRARLAPGTTPPGGAAPRQRPRQHPAEGERTELRLRGAVCRLHGPPPPGPPAPLTRGHYRTYLLAGETPAAG